MSYMEKSMTRIIKRHSRLLHASPQNNTINKWTSRRMVQRRRDPASRRSTAESALSESALSESASQKLPRRNRFKLLRVCLLWVVRLGLKKWGKSSIWNFGPDCSKRRVTVFAAQKTLLTREGRTSKMFERVRTC